MSMSWIDDSGPTAMRGSRPDVARTPARQPPRGVRHSPERDGPGRRGGWSGRLSRRRDGPPARPGWVDQRTGLASCSSIGIRPTSSVGAMPATTSRCRSDRAARRLVASPEWSTQWEWTSDSMCRVFDRSCSIVLVAMESLMEMSMKLSMKDSMSMSEGGGPTPIPSKSHHSLLRRRPTRSSDERVLRASRRSGRIGSS